MAKTDGLKWFTETFLQSFEAKMYNPKYPNRCIISEAQARVCREYMEASQHRDDWGHYFTTWSIEVDGFKYLLSYSGKYNILSRTLTINNTDWDREAQIIIDRGLFEEATREIGKDICDKVEADAKKYGETLDSVDFLGDCLFWYHQKYKKIFTI